MTLSSVENNSVLNVWPSVGMHNSALVLKDEDGNSVNTELEEFSGSESNIVPSAINIENSSDVIIGPVTQFNGPVTIYQSVTGSPQGVENGSANYLQDGKLVKSESTSSDSPPHSSEKTSTKNAFWHSKQAKIIAVSFFIVAVLAIVATATILAIKSDNKVSTPRPPTKRPNHQNEDYPDDNDDHDDPLKPAGPGAIIEKKDWGGRPALNFTKPLKHPVKFVIISHSATPTCEDFPACCRRVQSMQTFHVSNRSPDIGYNFVIGGDGNAYVGRGWDIQNFHRGDSIGINFIGNYVYDYLTDPMISIAKELLEIGVKKGKLAANYTLVAHNQTYATQSPGAHIYEVIKTWPHFDPRSYI